MPAGVAKIPENVPRAALEFYSFSLRFITSYGILAGGSKQSQNRPQLSLRPLSDLPAAVRQLPALALLSRLVSQEQDDQPGTASSSGSTAAMPSHAGAQPQRHSAKPAGREAQPPADSSGLGSIAAAARSWGGALVGGVWGVLRQASGQAVRDSEPIARLSQQQSRNAKAQDAGDRAEPPASPSSSQVSRLCAIFGFRV